MFLDAWVQRFSPVFLVLVALVLLGGCATTGHPRGSLLSGHGHGPPVLVFLADSSPARRAPSAEVAGSAGGFSGQEADAFQGVQEACGLEEDTRHPVGAALYLEQARQLRDRLAKKTVTQRSFGPCLVLSWLLREVLEEGERVEYAKLPQRLERFRHIVTVRPDGYLMVATNGQPIQRLGQVMLEEGEFRVGRLVVGAFYFSHGGVLYPVDEALQRIHTSPWAEVGLGRDPLNAALDGAQDAMGELVFALAQSVLHPIQTAEGLTQLPTTVALLIASSPEYFARFGAMSLQDQIREAARLSTHLMMMYGGAAGTVGRMGGLGAELPVLSVTASGELAVGRVLVAAGTVTTTLGAELGAVSILHMASGSRGNPGRASGKKGKTASTTGPGRWTHKTPTTQSKEALDYHEQVTGQPPWRVYMIGEVEFDGFTGRELLEAKGPNYINFFNKDGTPQYWYVASGKFNQLVEQAGRQSKMAERVKLPLVWHVADAEVAKFLRTIFEGKGWTNIDVRHTQPAQ